MVHEVTSCNKKTTDCTYRTRADQYELQKDEEEEEEQEEERKKEECRASVQSIFSFWTSLGASTNSFPLKRMTAAVRVQAVPQNTTYASVSVHVSPESERGANVRQPFSFHRGTFSRVLGSKLEVLALFFLTSHKQAQDAHGEGHQHDDG